MKLIINLGTKINKSGNLISYGEFLCSFCLQIVERQLGNGLRAKSCGCVKNKLISESQKGKNHSEETKQKIRDKRELQKPPMKGKHQSEEARQKVREANTGKIVSEEARQKMRENHADISGKNNPMYGRKGILSPQWNNGSSFEPYSPEFNKDLKQSILERDNCQCQDPNCEYKTNLLDIHHIDYNKLNSNPENLITLCDSCHTKTNGKNKRQYWTEFYQNIMMDKLMECLL